MKKTEQQPTHNEIISGNELMARFIGGIKCVPSWEKENGFNRACWAIPIRSDHMFEPLLPESLHFHNSWDWILPVWILWLHDYIHNPIGKTETYLIVRDAILSGNITEVWATLKDDLEMQQIKLN